MTVELFCNWYWPSTTARSPGARPSSMRASPCSIRATVTPASTLGIHVKQSKKRPMPVASPALARVFSPMPLELEIQGENVAAVGATTDVHRGQGFKADSVEGVGGLEGSIGDGVHQGIFHSTLVRAQAARAIENVFVAPKAV